MAFFKKKNETPDNAAAAVATPAVADAGQADASDEALASDSASAEHNRAWKEMGYMESPLIVDPAINHEAVVENPTLAPVAKKAIGIQGESLASSENIQQNVTSADINGDAIFTEKESPLDQKIHNLVSNAPDIEGWSRMDSAPHDGMRVMVSETGTDKGTLAYWRISKYVDKKALRYIPKGRWTDFLTRLDITFEPKYWQPYDAEKFYPVGG